jgi:ABC-type glycerol-3-phosphate transport system substrate-binding protein
MPAGGRQVSAMPSLTRRSILRGAATVIGLTSLAALSSSCIGSKLGTSEAQGDVAVWTPTLAPDDSVYWTPLTARLRQAYPRLRVTVELLAWAGRTQRLLSAIAAGTPPDVAYVNRDLSPRLIDDGSIVSIDDLLTREQISDFHPTVWSQAKCRERAWGVPAVLSIQLPVINAGLAVPAGLDMAATPAGWDSLETWGNRLTISPDQWGLSHPWNSDSAATTLIGWIWQAGGEVIDEPDGRRALFNSEEGVAALTYVKRLFDKGYIQVADKHGQGIDFASGRIGTLLWGGTSTPAHLASAAPGIAYVVDGAIAGRKRVATGMLASYAILTNGRNRSGAEAFARFIARTDSLAEIARATSYLPPVRSVSAESIWPGDQARAKMVAEIPHLRLDIQHKSARTISRILAEEGQAALLDRKSPARALADASHRLEAEMAQ